MNNINWNKVKIKHVLGIAKDLPGYPDENDVMFHLVKEIGDRKDPSFTDVQISAQLKTEQEEIRRLLLILSEVGNIKITKVTDEKMIVKVAKNPYL
jgi:transcription initiation factor IIE alpha subunit